MAEASAVTAGTTIDWANESHLLSVAALKAVPSNIVLDDAYRRSNLPVLDGQLGRAGLRLANLLNLAFATGHCTADQPN
ncbi:S1/P1 nuclease [Mesorhizobium sp. M0998]|uniref:S1/P1 nuclease n=1 Tax=Mesorhizobium sp. M0998 TaxID=2957044 RepID=UPI00333B492C